MPPELTAVVRDTSLAGMACSTAGIRLGCRLAEFVRMNEGLLRFLPSISNHVKHIPEPLAGLPCQGDASAKATALARSLERPGACAGSCQVQTLCRCLGPEACTVACLKDGLPLRWCSGKPWCIFPTAVRT